MNVRKLFLMISVFLLFSCKKKETIIEVEKEVIVYQEPSHKWKRVKEFDINQSTTITNSKRLQNGSILFTTNYYNILYDSISDKFLVKYANQAYERQVRPLITSSFFLNVTDNGISVRSLYNSMANINFNPNYTVDPLSIDSSFFHYNFKNVFFSSDIIGNANTILYPNYTSSNIHKYTAVKFKKAITPISFPDSAIIIDTFKIITNTNYINTNRVASSIGSNLFFSMGDNKNYILDYNLDTFYVNDYVYGCIFKLNNSFSSFCSNPSIGGGTKLISTVDDGLTWQTIISGVDFQYEQYSYMNIGNKIIAHYYNHIWEIVINNNIIVKKELVNDGLEDKFINSIQMSNGKVFIGTNNGLFERSFSEFLEYK
jgi:hypothetical protein